MEDYQFLVSLFYAYVGFVCCLVVSIILNRTRATKFKESVDKNLLYVFRFFIAFTLVDAGWGLVGALWCHDIPLMYIIVTYAFHLFAALSSVFIAFYAVYFLKLNGKVKKAFAIYRICLFVLQLGLIITNIVCNILGKPFWFTIDNTGAYHTDNQNLRRLVFGMQFMQYVPLMIYAIIYIFIRLKQKKSKTTYLSGAFFLLIPLVFGILQMLYPDGPFYSLGFAVFAVSIYSVTITKQREDILSEYSRVEEGKKNQEAISKALANAQEANKAKSVFLANMSHDIRTPINGIMGITTLLENEEMSPKVREYINKIDSTSHHLLSLVNDVLDMSLIENKQDALLALEPMDIRTIVNNCSSIIEGQLINRKIKFECKYLTKIEHSAVLGDELRLRQILINILGNSVKFTPEGGLIKMEVSEVISGNELVNYRFDLSDTGIGMKPEFIEHLFEPFSQESNASRTKYQGTGLGMSICKQLVDLMKGTIEVTSVEGKGTKFVLNIPFRMNKEVKPIIKEEIADDVSIAGTKILLVEDNELNMEIACSILETFDVNITKVFNGQEAVDAFANNAPHTFDVILMDIMMPILNGYDATRAIRKLDREDAKQIPIIAMTANAFEEDKKQAMLAGMSAHVAKPIDFKKLKAEIYKLTKK